MSLPLNHLSNRGPYYQVGYEVSKPEVKNLLDFIYKIMWFNKIATFCKLTWRQVIQIQKRSLMLSDREQSLSSATV